MKLIVTSEKIRTNTGYVYGIKKSTGTIPTKFIDHEYYFW